MHFVAFEASTVGRLQEDVAYFEVGIKINKSILWLKGTEKVPHRRISNTLLLKAVEII